MEVQSINRSLGIRASHFTQKSQNVQNLIRNNNSPDLFVKTQQDKINFGHLQFSTVAEDLIRKTKYWDMANEEEREVRNAKTDSAGILLKEPMHPGKRSLSAKEAIELFDKLKNGSYIAAGLNKNIKETNLSFLNCIRTPKARKEFVEYYKKLTGFPNLEKVSANIKNEFIRAAKATQAEMESKSQYSKFPEFFEIIGSGYDGVSSVGKNLALPGSDLNNAYIIIRGAYSFEGEEQAGADWLVANEYLKRLLKNTDHRILSYGRHSYSMPQLYTEAQIKFGMERMEAAAEKAFTPDPLLSLIPFVGWMMVKGADWRLKEHNARLENFNPNYMEANGYFMDLCKLYGAAIPNVSLFKFGMFLESLSKGEMFKPYDNGDIFAGTISPHYINLSQITAQKKENQITKDILQERVKLQKEFNSWSLDEQFDFIKSMIMASAHVNYTYPNYYKSNLNKAYKGMKEELGLPHDA